MAVKEKAFHKGAAPEEIKALTGEAVITAKMALRLLTDRPTPKRGGYDRVDRKLAHNPLGADKWILSIACWRQGYVARRIVHRVDPAVADELLRQGLITRGPDAHIQTYVLDPRTARYTPAQAGNTKKRAPRA